MSTLVIAAQSELAPGELVGAYRIVGQIGQGGMGAVYRGVHALLERPAAIKVLHPEYGQHSMVVDRFLDEARATTAIRHPGIVQIYDYGYTESGRAYIAMELLVGHTLGERLRRAGRLGLADALGTARQIAATLAAAHECGVVHRDLKPDNIFLSPCPDGGAREVARILDFGIAKVANRQSGRTTVGVVLGTPAYMSPEQSMAAGDCDHRTDLYSLGCVLFEMLAGRRPFQGTFVELMAAHLASPPPDVRDFIYVPPAVAALVARLLAKDPAERYPHAQAVIAAIDAVDAPAVPTVRVRRIRRRFANGTLAAVGALAAACSGAGVRQWVRYARSTESLAPTVELAVVTPELTGTRIATVARDPKPPPPVP